MPNSLPAPADAGLASAWTAAANIDLSVAMAVGRASARAIAELSSDAARTIRRRLEEEAVALEDKGGLESETAAILVRRTLDPAG